MSKEKNTKPASSAANAKASMLAVMRGINLSDGPMYSIMRDGSVQPVAVVRHGIRGTQNVSKKKNDSDADVGNPQITETAKTDPAAIGLRIQFAMQITPLRKLVTACNHAAVSASIQRFLTEAEDSEELMEICRRYARRIFNGSFLWRNLTLADLLDISATCDGQTVEVTGEQPFSLAGRGFSDYVDAEGTLARWLQRALTTDGGIGAGIAIKADMRFAAPGAFEVYPSQVYVSSKPKGFARPLYKLNPLSPAELSRQRNTDDRQSFMDSINMGQAGIRDQKIGNAIRTIDTWYAEGDVRPIAVEPNGASLSDNSFYRDPSSSNSFFSLLPRIDELTQQLSPADGGAAPTAQAMFALAVFIRGGVFGESGKSESA